MSKYKILKGQELSAQALGVTIKPSTRKGKKIDVFKDGKKVASIGAIGYADFWTYMLLDASWAAKKRKAYQARHNGEQLKVGSPGYYAWHILW